MDCWYPITVPKHHNVRNKRNGLLYTRVYGRMSVPCGRCPACRRRKQNEWAFRMLEEAKNTRLTAFVTLTYDDEFLPFSDSGIPTLFPDHLTTFFKNLRYDIGSFRYFACGEYGDQFDRPHYHFCLFYNGSKDDEFIETAIARRWKYGFIKYDSGVSAGRAKYCAKYSMKQIGFDYSDCVPPFARMSRRPGLGKQFLDLQKMDVIHRLDQWFVHDYQGTPYSLPRYYKERIYSKDEIDIHSLLLERTKNLQFDFHIREFNDGNVGSFFESDADNIMNRERLFIKHLKKENYGFKFKTFKELQGRSRISGDDLVTDEF